MNYKPINYEKLLCYQILHGDPLSNRSQGIKDAENCVPDKNSRRKFRNCNLQGRCFNFCCDEIVLQSIVGVCAVKVWFEYFLIYSKSFLKNSKIFSIFRHLDKPKIFSPQHHWPTPPQKRQNVPEIMTLSSEILNLLSITKEIISNSLRKQ